MSTLSAADIPLEIWVRIFYWATFIPIRARSNAAPSIPLFDAITHSDALSECRLYSLALSDKVSLSLVSRRWRHLTMEFLFEDIRIRHGAASLANQLEASRDGAEGISLGLGKFVKRIVLPRAREDDFGHSNHWADSTHRRIIECCPNVLELSRYHDIYVKPSHRPQQVNPLEDPSGIFTPQFDPSLPSVRRVDWDNGVPPHMLRTVGAAPTAIWTSQTLESLSLSGDNYFWNAADLQSWGNSTIRLPRLHTLRVNSLYAFGVPGVANYVLSVPSLRRVILDRAEALHRLIECVLAPQSNPTAGRSVDHVEIGAPYWRCLHSDYISSLVKYCPNAQTLHYPLFFARVLRWKRLSDGRNIPSTTLFPNMRTVGWHGARNTELWAPENARLNPNAASGGGVVWVHLMRHLETLIGEGSRMPGIEEIKLYGKMWNRIVTDTRFHSALDLAAHRDVRFIPDDSELGMLLEEANFDYRTDTVLTFLQSL